MAKWSWRKAIQCVAGVGASMLASSAVMAQDVSQIPDVANPDSVFRQTSYALTEELGCQPQCAAPNACAPGPGCGTGRAGCGAGCDSSLSSMLDGGGLLGGELGDPWTLSSVLGEDAPVTIGGWTQFGYHNDSDGIFNTHPDHLDLQQFNLYMEKVADGSCGWGFGGRADLMYGTDAQNTQAFGNENQGYDFRNGWDHGIYGWALPQLYVEAANDNLSVKVGKFYTPLGYQVVPATGNFFYSIPFTFNFSEAFTHTGALATYKANDDVTLYGGWTLGWDTGFDQFGSGSNFLGGASVKATDSLTVTYITTIGDFGWIGEGYSHSLVADWIINDCWEYVLQSDTIRTNFHPLTAGKYDTVGINQYLYYTVNEKTKVGGRMEWWKADGTSYYETALGVNITPMSNLRIRPEVRHQWAPGATDANAFGIPLNDTIFGVDAIITF